MMSSSWKISLFGIVALMLAFGLATSDAGAAAHSDVEVTVGADTVGASNVLRAAQEGRILTFTLSLSRTAADKGGTIEISSFPRRLVKSASDPRCECDRLGRRPGWVGDL